tara:strand:+ start:104 stop:754 length:651 start_codon:yes stop_codon:yes gene_type:complete
MIYKQRNIILKSTIPSDLFFKLKERINKKSKSFTKELAGNIVREEDLEDFIPVVEPYLLHQIKMYEPFAQEVIPEYLKSRHRKKGHKVGLNLKILWTNYMKKHEFNPIHAHDGCFSFILFMEIPFRSEEMRKIAPGVKSNFNQAGGLTFYHKGSSMPFNFFEEEVLFPDETWEGQCLIFPAYLFHSVYPFYGTDGTRITISGNVFVEVINPPLLDE